MRLSEIWRYPVKSMAGERLENAGLGPLGIPGDREVVVVHGGGTVVSSRARPGLLLLHATRDDGGRVRVNGHDSDSPAAAELVRAVAGPTARLVRVEGPERFDILPLLVATDGAIGAMGVDGRRFRPNLVIGGVEGLAEREWEGRFLSIGDAVVGLERLRGRCIMTTFDPDTGVQDVRVLQRIQEEFDGTFALNAWVARGGRIELGATVRLLDAFDAEPPIPRGRFAR